VNVALRRYPWADIVRVICESGALRIITRDPARKEAVSLDAIPHRDVLEAIARDHASLVYVSPRAWWKMSGLGRE